MITGPELLTQVKDLQANGLTRDQILPQLGYTNPESGKLLYTKFYEALIEAKGGPLFAPDVLPEDQAEYEKLCDQYGDEAVLMPLSNSGQSMIFNTSKMLTLAPILRGQTLLMNCWRMLRVLKCQFG